MDKAKNFHSCLVHIRIASSWLLLLAGCDVAATPASPADLSTPSADLTMFIQRLAHEALAAFLF